MWQASFKLIIRDAFGNAAALTTRSCRALWCASPLPVSIGPLPKP